VVFVKSPAGLFSNLEIVENTFFSSYQFWIIAILGYYFLATMLPIDKIITKLYPLFGLLMIVMTVSVAVMLIIQAPHLEATKDIFMYFKEHKEHEFLTPNGLPIWPLLFTTITCGAISGFHSTQAPIMARCLTNEKYVRPVYYGAMMSEGIVACVWATAGIAAFPGGYEQLQALIAQGGPGLVVKEVSTTYLGAIGGVIAIIAVAIFPITSGDTAFRSLRLTIVDAFNVPQSMKNRLLLATPILLIAYAITFIDFLIIWRYFSFSNMLLSTSVLWLATKYLYDRGSFLWITALPASVGTAVTISYILNAEIGLGISREVSVPMGIAFAILGLVVVAIGLQKRPAAA
jgi:carbon starvation protein CstA